jgi:D-glycero-D-manno-heptose 1,7-bisphosphate phosphatase
MTPALFLDRDGTLSFDKHHIHKPEDMRPFPGTREALLAALSAGYRLFILTNQSGIGRGIFQWADYEACNARLLELLDLPPGAFTEIKAAPETPDEPSLYRKPSPRFILEMVEKYQLDASKCWMIGDRKSDWESGLNAGIRSAAVASGAEISDEVLKFIQEKKIPFFPDFPSFARDYLRLLP